MRILAARTRTARARHTLGALRALDAAGVEDAAQPQSQRRLFFALRDGIAVDARV